MNLEMLKRMMIKLLQEPEPKPRQVSVVDLTVCVGQRTVHECLNVALVNTSVDRACSARSVGRSIGLELAWCLKTNTAFPPLQRHLGPPCLRPPLADPSQILRRSFADPLAVCVSSPSSVSFPSPSLYYFSSYLLSTLPSLRFHALTLIAEHGFPLHSCFISLLPVSFSSFPHLGLGAGASVSSGPSSSFPLSLTISHMSIRKRPLPPLPPPFPGPAVMLRLSTICCIHPGDG